MNKIFNDDRIAYSLAGSETETTREMNFMINNSTESFHFILFNSTLSRTDSTLV